MHRTIALAGIDLSGMRTIRTFITYIAALLSVATAVLSCSAGNYEYYPDPAGPKPERSILITGSVCDKGGQALKNISIAFKSYPQQDADANPISTETVYSSSNGEFSIHAEGADMDLICILTADDPEGIYESQNLQVFVSWKGVSFEERTQTYIVNDCNFALNRK